MLREVSKKVCLVANFGTAYTGLATVGYKLLNGDGTQFQARTTTGVAEVVAGTGIYRVEIANSIFTTDFDGYVQWDTGGGSPVYAVEDVHIVAELDAAVSTRSTYAGTDTPGTTTLLTRIAAALTITGGKVDVNDKTEFALTTAYDPAKTASQPGDAMALTTGERTTLAASIWSSLTSGLSAAGSIGKLLATNIDAAISSRLADADYTSPDNADIAAIKAQTDLLPPDPASESSILAAIAAIDVSAVAAEVWSYVTRTLTRSPRSES